MTYEDKYAQCEIKRFQKRPDEGKFVFMLEKMSLFTRKEKSNKRAYNAGLADYYEKPISGRETSSTEIHRQHI